MNVGGIHLQHTTHLDLTCLVGGFKFQPIWKIWAPSNWIISTSGGWKQKKNTWKTPPSCTFTGSWREKNFIHNISIHLHSDMSNLLMTSLLPCKLLRFSCFFDRLKYLNGGGHCNACGVNFSSFTRNFQCLIPECSEISGIFTCMFGINIKNTSIPASSSSGAVWSLRDGVFRHPKHHPFSTLWKIKVCQKFLSQRQNLAQGSVSWSRSLDE